MVQIDIFTLVAQILNFVILVLLLRRFLYPPIIKAMDRRAEIISARLEEAEQKKREALVEADSLREKQRELTKKREEILDQAREEALTLNKELLEKGRREVEANRANWLKSIESQKKEFLKDLRRRAGEAIITVTRRALGDLAGEELEGRIIHTFIGRLKNMTGDDIRVIKGFPGEVPGNIVVRSSFEIPDESRQKIIELLQDRMGTPLITSFEIGPEMISGIELDIQDMRITWSLKSYLDGLEEEIARVIEHESA